MRGAVINAEREEKGAITAFFSLSLLLIIALLTVLLESAHVGACRGIAERIMEVSVKSLLGSYSLPLYETIIFLHAASRRTARKTKRLKVNWSGFYTRIPEGIPGWNQHLKM